MKLASPASAGSSPRVRGTLVSAKDVLQSSGIIPACAGNTDGTSFMTVNSKDHPRVCGEHFVCRSIRIIAWGSSPRVRGTHACPVAFVQ